MPVLSGYMRRPQRKLGNAFNTGTPGGYNPLAALQQAPLLPEAQSNINGMLGHIDASLRNASQQNANEASVNQSMLDTERRNTAALEGRIPYGKRTGRIEGALAGVRSYEQPMDAAATLQGRLTASGVPITTQVPLDNTPPAVVKIGPHAPYPQLSPSMQAREGSMYENRMAGYQQEHTNRMIRGGYPQSAVDNSLDRLDAMNATRLTPLSPWVAAQQAKSGAAPPAASSLAGSAPASAAPGTLSAQLVSPNGFLSSRAINKQAQAAQTQQKIAAAQSQMSLAQTQQLQNGVAQQQIRDKTANLTQIPQGEMTKDKADAIHAFMDRVESDPVLSQDDAKARAEFYRLGGTDADLQTYKANAGPGLWQSHKEWADRTFRGIGLGYVSDGESLRAASVARDKRLARIDRLLKK